MYDKTIIILHGMHQDLSDIKYITTGFDKNKTKIVILKGNNSCKKGLSWYTYYTYKNNYMSHDRINTKHYNFSTKRLIEKIKTESKLIDPENIHIIGISQGGTICINAVMHLNFKIGSIFCIDTIFFSDYINYGFPIRQNFIALISKSDKIYNPNLQIECYDLLRFFGNDVKIFKRNSSHCENIKEIKKFITDFLQKNKLLKN